MFQSFLFPLLLTTAAGPAPFDRAAAWGWLVAGSSIAAIVLAPFVGRLADLVGKPRVFAYSVIAAGLLALIAVSGQTWLWFAVFFLLFNSIFELSQSLYDSFLLDVESSPSRLTNLSSFAWGFGYLGGALFAGAYFGMKKLNLPDQSMLVVFSLLFLACSIPALVGFSRLHGSSTPFKPRPTLRAIFQTTAPVPWLDIFVYWIIADCVAAILYFAPLYLSSEIHLTTNVVGGLILGAQLLAFPLTILMGRIANRVGRIRTIQVSLVIWALALGGLALSQSLAHVIPVVLGLSLVIGSTQAILRAHFASRIRSERSGEGLGYYAVAQKSASVVSPLLVVIITSLTNSLRPAFVALTVLVVIALVASRRLSLIDRSPQL
jgi:MFS transporter, UMF1 family